MKQTLKTVIDTATLTALALGYSAAAFKPFWKNAQGVAFYQTLEAAGFSGSALVRGANLTRFGYVNLHVTYPEKPRLVAPVITAARAPRVIATRAPRVTKAKPVSKVINVTLAQLLAYNETDRALIADMAKNGKLNLVG